MFPESEASFIGNVDCSSNTGISATATCRKRGESLADTILRHDAGMSPVSTYVNTNFFTDINGTTISTLTFIGYSEQLWQLERRDQVLKKEVLNYKRISYLCPRYKRDNSQFHKC